MFAMLIVVVIRFTTSSISIDFHMKGLQLHQHTPLHLPNLNLLHLNFSFHILISLDFRFYF
jgi:hypothetical protein